MAKKDGLQYREDPSSELPLAAKHAGFAYSAAIVAILVVELAAELVVWGFSLSSDSDGVIYLSYLVSPIAICIGLAVLHFGYKIPVKGVYKVKCNWRYYLWGVLIIFGTLFALSYLNDLFIEGLEKLGYTAREASSYYPNLGGGRIVLALFVIALLPAVAEEALFRGVVLKGLDDSLGSVAAVLLSGLLFSLYHGNPEHTIYQFLVGCIFGLVALRSGSIFPTMLMHFLNNATILVLAAAGGLDEAGNLAVSDAAMITLVVVGAVALIGGIVAVFLDKGKTRKKGSEQGGAWRFFAYAAVGIVIMLVTWILNLVG